MTLLQMLLGRLGGGGAFSPLPGGTGAQQAAGSYGALGGALGTPYGLYGAFYGPRVPDLMQGIQDRYPALGGLGGGLGAR